MEEREVWSMTEEDLENEQDWYDMTEENPEDALAMDWWEE